MNAAELKNHILSSYDGIRVMEASGDTFFIYDPDGDIPPERVTPFMVATIVTDDNYDRVSNLSSPGAYRLNIGLTKATYTALFGTPPTQRGADGVLDTGFDYATRDRLMPHPFYASQHWVCVVSPSGETLDTVRPLLTEAHDFASRKYANHQARRTKS